MTQSYMEMQQGMQQSSLQQYPPQGQQFAAQNSAYGGAYIPGTATSSSQGAGYQPMGG